jgi:WD40 repeat protein
MRVRKLSKNEQRVTALMFLDGLLVSGSKDKSILVHDLRQRDHVVKEFTRHKGEVCTLKAKNSTEKIFASGSVDGSAIIWDLKFGYIDQLKGHKGAVKSLAWCPWKSGILATGGGSQT